VASALAERTDAAENVTGNTLGDGWIAQLHGLGLDDVTESHGLFLTELALSRATLVLMDREGHSRGVQRSDGGRHDAAVLLAARLVRKPARTSR
jgi:hypothetical protein